MIDLIRHKYENARDFFYQNYDNPKYSERALEEYKKASEVYYFFMYGSRIRDKTTSLVDRLRMAGL